MKIKYAGDFGFVVTTPKGDLGLSHDQKGTLINTFHEGNLKKEPKHGEFNLGLPCEMEIREILIKGIESHKGNVVYHFADTDLSFAHFGKFSKEEPIKGFYSQLGESLDIALVVCHSDFDARAIDKFLDTLSPRVAIVAAPPEMVAAIMTETGGEKAETNEIKIKKANLSAETEKVWVVSL